MGEKPVPHRISYARRKALKSRFLELERYVGGNVLPTLNIMQGPVAKKYREGNMKSFLKRELKVSETVGMEALGVIWQP